MSDVKTVWSQQNLKNSQLFKIVRPILLALCSAQCFFALCLLALGIAGVVLDSTFAYLGMPIWAGFFGCALSAVWAGTSSRPTQHSHGMVLMIVVKAAHTALFVLSFVAASVDFTNLLTSLNAITSTSINCASLLMVNPNVLMGRLLVDIFDIVVTLIPMIADTAIIYYGCRIYGRHGFICNKPRSETLSTVNLSNVQSPGADVNGEVQVDVKARDKMMKVIKKMMMRLIWPFMSLMLTLTIAAIAIAIVGLVLGVQVGLPPPVWNVVSIILGIMGSRKLKKGKKNWHVFLFVSFAIGGAGNIAVIVIGGVNLQLGWNYINNLYRVTNALAVCATNSTAATVTTTATGLSTLSTSAATTAIVSTLSAPRNNYSEVWLLVLEILHIMLNFYLAVLMIVHVIVLVKVLQFMKKRAAGKQQQQKQQPQVTQDNQLAFTNSTFDAI